MDIAMKRREGIEHDEVARTRTRTVEQFYKLLPTTGRFGLSCQLAPCLLGRAGEVGSAQTFDYLRDQE
jgi:hypothetical protein